MEIASCIIWFQNCSVSVLLQLCWQNKHIYFCSFWNFLIYILLDIRAGWCVSQRACVLSEKNVYSSWLWSYIFCFWFWLVLYMVWSQLYLCFSYIKLDDLRIRLVGLQPDNFRFIIYKFYRIPTLVVKSNDIVKNLGYQRWWFIFCTSN